MDGRSQARKELTEKENPLKDTLQNIAKNNKLRKRADQKSLVAETEDLEITDNTFSEADKNPMKFLKDLKKNADKANMSAGSLKQKNS